MKMHWLVLLFVLLTAWPQNGQGQAISYRKEMITVNGKLYAYLEKGGSVWARDYTLRNRQHLDLANARAVTTLLADGLEYTYYEISFVGFEEKAEMEDSYDFARRLAREFVIFNLLQLDTLNPDGVNKFLAKYPPRISQRLRDIPPPYQPESERRKKKLSEQQEGKVEEHGKPANGTGPKMPPVELQTDSLATSPKTVGLVPEKPEFPLAPAVTTATIASRQRNALKEISINGFLIRKGEESIGRYAEMIKTSPGGPVNHFAFFNSANIEVSHATQTPQDKLTYQVFSAKDRKTRTLKVRPDEDPLQFLAEWLAKNRYL